MDIAYFMMLIHELLNKDPDIVPGESPLIILGRKSAVSMANNGKDTNHTRQISRRVFYQWLEMKNAQHWLVWSKSAIDRNCN